MPEFMRGVDAETADEAHGHGEPHAIEGAEIRRRDVPEGEGESDVLQRQEEIGEPAVVAVLLEGLDHVIGWIGRIEARGPVNEGDEAEDDDGAEPQPDTPAGR